VGSQSEAGSFLHPATRAGFGKTGRFLFPVCREPDGGPAADVGAPRTVALPTWPDECDCRAALTRQAGGARAELDQRGIPSERDPGQKLVSGGWSAAVHQVLGTGILVRRIWLRGLDRRRGRREAGSTGIEIAGRFSAKLRLRIPVSKCCASQIYSGRCDYS
jgi:hypothetical protein